MGAADENRAGTRLRIAVIGAGVSGLAAARVLARFGHEVVVYEKAPAIGGIWLHTYPEVRLQNIAEHYRLSDFPWPFAPDQHPTAAQVLRYLEAVAAAFAIDIRLRHELITAVPEPDGWALTFATPEGERGERVDHLVVAVGLYGGPALLPALPNRERFGGEVVTDDAIADLSVFDGRRVAVVGFGKTAVDLATFAAERGAQSHHVFRAARWLLPRRFFGHHMADLATARSATVMLPSWVHPGAPADALHRRLPWLVSAYWRATEFAVRLSTGLHPFHLDPHARARLRRLEPHAPLTYHMRAAAALAPDAYYRLARAGRIIPHRGEISGMTETGLVLASGEVVPADLVVLAVGRPPPAFPFLPPEARALLTEPAGGGQLYRHLLHPRLPRLAFAGYNHAFLHIACVEVAMVWYGALIAGDIELPSLQEMEASTARVTAWKRAHGLFEPTQAWGIGGRIHQYLDVLLQELGVSPRRKRRGRPERFEPYGAADYAGVFDDYRAARGNGPRTCLPLDT